MRYTGTEEVPRILSGRSRGAMCLPSITQPAGDSDRGSLVRCPDCSQLATVLFNTCGARLPDVGWTLLSDRDAFYLEHRRCSDLDGGADALAVWLACSCGGVIRRPSGDARAEPRSG